MALLTQIERGNFLKLFNRGGYVLNFSTNDFDVFTMNSIGIALCEKYRMSKGKSLTAYVNDAPEKDAIKLLLDLFDYYEDNYENEFVPQETESYYFGIHYNSEYCKTYKKCKIIADRIRNVVTPLSQNGEDLKEKFSSDYLSRQIDSMFELQSTNPTDAIGKAKELIESCCKTILDEQQIAWDKNWDVGKLATQTLEYLQLTPSYVPDTDPAAATIKAILGNLRAIATKLAELRNPYGSGHGKSSSYTGLEPRHAKLAVGSSITFVSFLWDTYEGRKK